jgi:KR domain-containing protein
MATGLSEFTRNLAQLAVSTSITAERSDHHAAIEYSGVELEHITVEGLSGATGQGVGIALVLAMYPRTEESRILLRSSIAASVGGRGLALYAAGNRMLDAMAIQLRSQGLDCIAGQWVTGTFTSTARGRRCCPISASRRWLPPMRSPRE